MREPWSLPEDPVELPAPGPAPGSPPTLNLISSILPPVMMLGVVFIYAQMIPSANLTLMILMPMMSMAFPIGSLISYQFQKKEYRKKLALREENYRGALSQIRERAETLVQQQRGILEREYPPLSKSIQIALGHGSRRRLWWRRPGDPDFLALRMGTATSQVAFKLTPPRVMDLNEPLMPLVTELIDAYREAPNLASLLELQKVGSVAVGGKSEVGVFNLARRLVLDVLIHHSPQDVEVVVLADTEEAQARWSWLKWAPHTRAILQGESTRRLAFDPSAIDKCLLWLESEYDQRRNPEPGLRKRAASHSAIVVLVDDSGELRHSGEVRQLAEAGGEADIFLLFVGGRNWPRECHARIDVTDREFSYVETGAREKSGGQIRGSIDSASLPDCERVARALASLELTKGKDSSNLPESVRLYDLLDVQSASEDVIRQNWQRLRADDELLQFPFGFRAGRKGLEDVTLNLLPEDLGGSGSYHTILVGTTGSGKSEFMKSMVLSAAYTYSPSLLNFFFMDFKGGAAFNVLKDLPHVVGVVTNLSPQLVERGLSAMEAEIDRRQRCFAEDGVQNLWAYNARHPDQPLPHLMLLLDEFARGMEEFPRLPEMLDRLVRQGRSLGMYLLLANQDVNAAVDRLLNNVGWRIALKVARQEEMHIIDRALPIPKRPGQGYLLSTNDSPAEFQAGYSGFGVIDPEEQVQEAFRVFQVHDDGKWQLIHSSAPQARTTEKKRPAQSEQDHLIALMNTTARDVEPAHPIYLDPLPERISLEAVFEESALKRLFDGSWNTNQERNERLLAPVGFLDSPAECLQAEMEIDFDDRDGHLWIVGAPGSGKAMTLETILLSLALTHTPEQVWFYILEYGAGRLLKFESLPHTGAVLRSTDPVERLDKLLNFLDEEMDRRTARSDSEGQDHNQPAVFLVIDNFAEMRANYQDHAERISRYARDGKAVGLHLIIATNRRIELGRLSIARRIVLRLANRDEYMDAVGKSTLMPAVQAEGRGYWVVDQRVVECQIAIPEVRQQGESALQETRTVNQAMARSWSGARARPILVVPTHIPLSQLMAQARSAGRDGLPIPVGLSFETMELVTASLLREIPRWSVVGPPRSGKSNFLACLAHAVLEQAASDWDVYYLALRRSPLEWVKGKAVRVANSVDAAVQACNELLEYASQPPTEEQPGKKRLILIDDLGAAFEPGKESLASALNNLALKIGAHEDIFLAAAGLADELRSQQTMSQLVRGLKQSRTGICLSRNSDDMDWFGAQTPPQYRRLELPPGRGFWVGRGNPIFVQTPVMENEHVDR